ASTAGDELSIQANGTITTTGVLAADDIAFATGNNGSVALGANVTGTTTVSINANGSGNITQSAGTVAGGTLVLTSGTGNIGSSGNALDTAVTSLTVNSGGTSDIFIS